MKLFHSQMLSDVTDSLQYPQVGPTPKQLQLSLCRIYTLFENANLPVSKL